VTQDRYIPGVPCWVETTQPDPPAAAAFYGELFGWEFEDRMPPEADEQYLVAQLRGHDVAAVGSVPQGAPAMVTWNTYIWVQSADATAERVRAAGGTVVAAPFDVFDAGRMAVFTDLEGAHFSVWEPRGHRGATLVNEHGTVNFNDLHTRDPEAAKRFYGAVFGWETLDLGDFSPWTLPGYGDFLEQMSPGMRERMAELGAPAGFEDVVASLNPIGPDQPDTPPHWGVTFAVDDADAVAANAERLGATVLAGPFDAPWVRMAVISDPQGATFAASTFVPDNRDLVPAADGAPATS
jgi:uncharacterized protein